jgi:hypothetical protein
MAGGTDVEAAQGRLDCQAIGCPLHESRKAPGAGFVGGLPVCCRTIPAGVQLARPRLEKCGARAS